MRTLRTVLLALVFAGLPLTIGASDFVTYESITVAATAIGITATITNPDGRPQQAACTARLETAQVRFRFDGTAPTSSEGQLLEIGETVEISNNADARRIQFIRTGSTSGTLKVSCWR